MVPPQMVTVDFHCHTSYSKDSLVGVIDMLKMLHKKGLDRLALTDHNNIDVAVQAQELDPDRFIIGEEVLTQQGEILAFFLTEPVPPHLSAHQTIQKLRDQGAFISVSHPFDSLRKGHWELKDLLDIMPEIDAIEVFNSRCMQPQANEAAKDFAQQHGLLGTVGSDAHSLGEIGAASLTLPDFHDAASLKQSLAVAESHTHLSSPFVHFYSRYASWRKSRSKRA